MRRGAAACAVAALLVPAAGACGDTGASGSGEVAVYAIERAVDGVGRAEQAAEDAEPFIQGPGSEAVGVRVDRARKSLSTTAGHLEEALAAAEAGDFAAAEQPVGLAQEEASEAVNAGNAASDAALAAIGDDPDAIRALLLAADDLRDQAFEADLDVTAAAAEVEDEL